MNHSLLSIATICGVLTLLLAPIIPVYFLIPLIIASQSQLPRHQALWIALGAGCLVDLLSADGPFGLFALDYCLTTALLWSLRKVHFHNTLATWPLLTAIWSASSTLLVWPLRALLGDPLPICGFWFVTDLLCLALLDALFAACLALALAAWGRERQTTRPFHAKRPS